MNRSARAQVPTMPEATICNPPLASQPPRRSIHSSVNIVSIRLYYDHITREVIVIEQLSLMANAQWHFKAPSSEL